MKHIFSYFLVGLCWIGFSANAADYSEYTSKDAQSFVNSIKDSKQLSVALSDSSTKICKVEQILLQYDQYKSYFSSDVPFERLIPFHVMDEGNKTILRNIYIPSSLFLKKAYINVFLQKTPEGKLEPLYIKTKYCIISSKQLLRNVLHKVVHDQLKERIEINNIILSEIKKIYLDNATLHAQEVCKINEVHMLAIQRIKSEHEEKIEKCKEKLEQERQKYKTLERQKRSSELDYKAKLSDLTNKANKAKESAQLLETLLKTANETFLKKEREWRNIALQRNILLCLIPVFIVITSLWCINNKTTIT